MKSPSQKKSNFPHLSETKPIYYISLLHRILYFYFYFHWSGLMFGDEIFWRSCWITYRWPWISHPVYPESGWWARWQNLSVQAANIHSRPMNMAEHLKGPQLVQNNKHGRLNSQSQHLKIHLLTKVLRKTYIFSISFSNPICGSGHN